MNGGAVTRLVEASVVPDGTVLHLRPGGELSKAGRDKLKPWVAEDLSRGRAKWQNNLSAPLVWEHDGKPYAPTRLVMEIVHQATGIEPSAIQGTRSWADSKGRNLPELAEAADVNGTAAAS